jgi:DNA-binding transcriptional ArsR family regulator
MAHRNERGSSCSLDALLKLLSSEQRRRVLSYLERKASDTTDLETLVDHIHDEVDDVTAPKQARLALVHNHLPKLATHGIIEYDQRSETVQYRDGDRLETLLEGIPTDNTSN